MIFVCEPQCKGVSHEKVNSGFLYGLRLAFPAEPIRFYAHPTHIKAIREILEHDGVVIDNIEYVDIEFGEADSLLSMPAYLALLRQIFLQTLSAGQDKIFFLSFSAKILFLIKCLQCRQIFSGLKFTLVLHGEFEKIAGDIAIPDPVTIPPAIQRLRKVGLQELPRRAVRRLRVECSKKLSTLSGALSSQLFPLERMLKWRCSPNFRFIALAPYIQRNAKKYMDVAALNLFTVTLPTVFRGQLPVPSNNFPKFAVFGYGNAGMLNKVLQELSKKDISQPYEIRIIGMDSRGIDGFKNVTAPISGRVLTRQEMEGLAVDIDAFLILYPAGRYRLSCSGSIFEALSYMKPVVHFRNECIDFFNDKSLPIGVQCNTIESYAEALISIINDYSDFQAQSKVFRNHILMLRDKYSIESAIGVIRESFTWLPAQTEAPSPQ